MKTVVLNGVPNAGVLVGLVDGLWPLWDPEHRAIHDMLAATRVVRADIARVDAPPAVGPAVQAS